MKEETFWKLEHILADQQFEKVERTGNNAHFTRQGEQRTKINV